MSYIDIYEKIENIDNKIIDLKQKKYTKTLNIYTIYDLIYYLPRIYDDRNNVKTIGELEKEEYVVVKANILSVSNLPTRSGKKMIKAIVNDGSGIMEIIWFGMPYLLKSLKIGEEYYFISQVKKANIYQMINPEFKLVKAKKNIDINSILPIYSTNKYLTQNTLRKIIKDILKKYIDYFEENLPEEILEKYKIMSRKKALLEIHFPSSEKNLESAKRRFAIEELFILETGILRERYKNLVDKQKKYQIDGKKQKVQQFLKSLSFELTKAQKKVITEIYKEINTGVIINRLIQGDVGSGKTIVAMIMLIYMVENGYQGVIMAPTEILATQHYLGVYKKLEALNLNVALLSSSIKGKKKEKLLQDIKNGSIDIVIGTHSLIEDNVIFKKLGLTIIDEQHRFGVNQRESLKNKATIDNLIVMSATPIPRSLALTIYGDLDVSIIDELPPGRTPIKTKWIKNIEDKELMFSFIDKKLNEGNQVYFVAPLIEESEKMNLESAINLFDEIKNRYKDFNVALLHGKMKSKEKDEIMSEFKEKKYNILVATTVIEVGIDVPNATIISIFSAERFGLSALHQLRGRVGRGKLQSFCFLVSSSKGEVAKQRLEIMEKTEDGFKIAEEDLKIRNTGEIFGLKQSGMSDLKFIDIIKDLKTIQIVRDECIEYLKNNNGEIKNKFLEMDIKFKFFNFFS